MFLLIAINPAFEYLQQAARLAPLVRVAFTIDKARAFRRISSEGYRKISFREVGNVLVIDIKEKKFPPEDATRFNYEVVSLAHNQNYSGYNKVVLNFKEVDYMNAAGLGALVSLNKRLRKNGGALEICCLPEQLKELMKITKLDTIISIRDSEPEALEVLQAA